jgi:thiamine transport system substrate-binding protein
MSNATESSRSTPSPLRRPGRPGRVVIAVAIAVAVTVAGIGAYQYYAAHHGPAPLVIYTYPGLMSSVSCGGPPVSGILANFSAAHGGIPIEVECPSGTLVQTLEAQASSPAADLVIGLDELTAPQAESLGLLVPYASPQLASVSASVVDGLSPDDYVTPYEYGFLGLDYTDAFASATGGAIANSSLENFTTNSSWARALLYEDPLIDITGEEFLAWTVEFYEHVLHEDWTDFWNAVLPYATDAGTWGTAFNTDFLGGTGPLVVSYTTDPASAVYYDEGDFFNTTVSLWGDALYSWETIYGIGIVAGTHHLALDQQFINYFLSGPVQSEFPLTEWEYPANDTVPLPSIYAALIPPSSITPLNEFTAGETPNEIATNLTQWQTTWESLAGA